MLHEDGENTRICEEAILADLETRKASKLQPGGAAIQPEFLIWIQTISTRQFDGRNTLKYLNVDMESRRLLSDFGYVIDRANTDYALLYIPTSAAAMN
jgi:hypothetical protein